MSHARSARSLSAQKPPHSQNGYGSNESAQKRHALGFSSRRECLPTIKKTLKRLDRLRQLTPPHKIKHTFKCLPRCLTLQKQAHSAIMEWMHWKPVLKGTLHLTRTLVIQAQVAYIEKIAREANEATFDLWDKLGYFRIGTQGRKAPDFMRLAPDYSTRIHRAYYTAKDASKAKVQHFAEVEGGYITNRQQISDLVTAEHTKKMQQQHTGKLGRLLATSPPQLGGPGKDPHRRQTEYQRTC